jgi:hypothetical protein
VNSIELDRKDELMTRTILAMCGGAILSAGLILACGDDAMQTVDAQATCDCPAAEPPLDGRIVKLTDTGAVNAGQSGVAAASCPEGGLVIGGGCHLEEQNVEITLNSSRPATNPEQWACFWDNPTTLDNVGVATAICLVPAE